MAGIKRKFEPSIKLGKAHDIRHFRACDHCKDLADRRYMVQIGYRGKIVHGGCALEILGLSGLLLLSDDEQDNLTLGEIGANAMRAIVEKRSN